MQYLLDNRYAPVTLEIGFLEAPIAMVHEAYFAWTREIYESVTVNELSAPLPVLLDTLDPLTASRRRCVWVETASNWTAFFTNGLYGADLSGPIHVMSNDLHCRGLVAAMMDHEVTASDAYLCFLLFDPESSHDVRRMIVLANDLRWEFNTIGEPLPFEEVERYQARRKKDRLTSEMVVAYCQAMGIRLNDDSFYVPHGFAYDGVTTMSQSTPVMSIKEANQRFHTKRM